MFQVEGHGDLRPQVVDECDVNRFLHQAQLLQVQYLTGVKIAL